MKLAVFSDVHANLPALEAVLDDLDRRQPDMVFCLGDLVGYAPWPNEVVQTVRERRIPTITGNYDEGVGLHSDDCGCAYRSDEEKRLGAESIAFTNDVVTEEARAYLRSLPRHIRLSFERPRQSDVRPRSVLMVHGSPRRINEYLFEDRPDRSFQRMMDAADADVMLFGHTHKPYHKLLARDSEESAQMRHAINTGSVGKPKDGDPRACYVLVDLDADEPADAGRLRVEFVRVSYDVERSAGGIERSSLPTAFADMLRRAL